MKKDSSDFLGRPQQKHFSVDPNIYSEWFDTWDINASANKFKSKFIPLNIVCVAPYFYPRIGGGETQLRLISDFLQSKGYSLTILTLRLPNTSVYETLNNIKVLRFGNSEDIKGRIKGYVEMYNFLKKNLSLVDILYLHLGVGNEYPTREMCHFLLLVQNCRIVTVVRVSSSGKITEFCNRYKEYLQAILHADLVIALNPGIKDELIKAGFQRSQIILMPNGVDVSTFHPASNHFCRFQLRQKYQIPNSSMVCVTHSRFAPKKRLPELIKIWGQYTKNFLVSTNSKPVFCIVGSGKHESDGTKIERKIFRALQYVPAESILMFPELDHEHVSEILRAADVYLSLSLQEGMSNALLEAMASGLFCIVPDTTENKALIRNGFNGLTFNSFDSWNMLDILKCAYSMGPQNRFLSGRHSRILCELYLRHDKLIETLESRFLHLYDKKALKSNYYTAIATWGEHQPQPKLGWLP